LLFFGCAQPVLSAPDLKAQIVANNAAWAAAANNGDAAGVAAMYTENATMVPPGQNSVRQVGRAAIE
jgi:ketosteroid isomerase-like protein